MSTPRHRRPPKVLLVVGLVALLGSATTHLALERHTVTATGELVELRDGADAHAHDERSLCNDATLDESDHPAPCLAEFEALVSHAPPMGRPDVSAPRSVTEPCARVAASGQGLWQLAPKASPPRG